LEVRKRKEADTSLAAAEGFQAKIDAQRAEAEASAEEAKRLLEDEVGAITDADMAAFDAEVEILKAKKQDQIDELKAQAATMKKLQNVRMEASGGADGVTEEMSQAKVIDAALKQAEDEAKKMAGDQDKKKEDAKAQKEAMLAARKAKKEAGSRDATPSKVVRAGAKTIERTDSMRRVAEPRTSKLAEIEATQAAQAEAAKKTYLDAKAKKKRGLFAVGSGGGSTAADPEMIELMSRVSTLHELLSKAVGK
jgi:hypothetical protein